MPGFAYNNKKGRKAVKTVLDYSPMWETMRLKEISQYSLLKAGIDNKTLDTLKKGNNITLLSGAGAWCASPVELARLVASIDGKDEIPDIISKEAIAQMTEYINKDTYSLGWNQTCPEKGWDRTGTLSGTTALIRYFPDGECWLFVSNTSTYRSNLQAQETDSLFRKCRKLYSKQLPARNLFEYEIPN